MSSSMKKINIILCCIIVILFSVWGWIYFSSTKLKLPFSHTSLQTNRQSIQIPLTVDGKIQQTPSIEATKLPKFVYQLTDHKFDSIVNAASDQVQNLAQATIVHTAYAQAKIDATISVDQKKRQLLIQPQDIPNFTPGLYRLSLKLRILEGEVNVEQDFSWGVIAVNTNKSIYKPGETAKIGIGVLNDTGETLCMKEIRNKVDSLSM